MAASHAYPAHKGSYSVQDVDGLAGISYGAGLHVRRDVVWIMWMFVLYGKCRDIDVLALLRFYCNMFVRVEFYRMEFGTLYSLSGLVHT